MRIIENIQCVYSYRDENNNLKGGKYECTSVQGKGSISFCVNKFNKQLVIDEKFLKEALRKNESLEIDGAYVTLNSNIKEIKTSKCIVHINVMPLVTNLYIVDSNEAIGLSNLELKSIMKC